MQPFNSVISYDGYFTPLGTSCEIIAFDSEHLNVFAAEVVYCQPHWHEAPELIYILRGEFEITVNQTAMTVKNGEFLYIDADLMHSLEQTEQNSALVTWQFAPRLFDPIHTAPNGYFVITTDNEQYQRFYDTCFTQLESLSSSMLSPFERLAKTYQILAEIAYNASQQSFCLIPIKSKEEHMIKEAIDYINCHFHEPITVADIAQHVNVSYFHFCRKFKKISGYTPAVYISMIRVNMAKPLLKDIHLPITEISLSVGFNEHSLMITAFKKYCGVTPSEYRKQYLADQEWRSVSNNLHAFPNRPISLKQIILSQ